jgi:hypothetical protein
MSRKVDLDLQAKILLETIAIQKKREQIEAEIRALDALSQHRIETEASREISNFYARHASDDNAKFVFSEMEEFKSIFTPGHILAA